MTTKSATQPGPNQGGKRNTIDKAGDKAEQNQKRGGGRRQQAPVPKGGRVGQPDPRRQTPSGAVEQRQV